MIAVMQIRTRMVHVVVSIVSCASDRGIGVLSQFDFVYLWGVGKYYCVFLFFRTQNPLVEVFMRFFVGVILVSLPIYQGN